MKNNIVLKKAFIDTLPIMAGYIVLGMGFGILLISRGYNIFVCLLMSIFIYAGSLQYLGVELLSAGAGIVATVILSLVVQARHIFYGISMIDKFKKIKAKKPYIIFALTDETYSVICASDVEEKYEEKYYFYVSMLDHIYWVLGSLLGASLGSLVKFNTKGVDFAMTALFISILVTQWQESKNRRYTLVGLALSAISLLLFGANKFLIPAMLGILLLLGYFYKKEAK